MIIGTKEAFTYFVENVYQSVEKKPTTLRQTVKNFRAGQGVSLDRMEEILSQYGVKKESEPIWRFD